MEHNISAKIELPEKLAKSRSIVNPHSTNNMCFWNCIAYHQSKNVKCAKLGVELYKAFYGSILSKDYKGFDYINEIKQYEEISGYAINIFDYEHETLQIFRK